METSGCSFSVVIGSRLWVVFGRFCTDMAVCCILCGAGFVILAQPNKGAAANSHCPFSFDRQMKFEHHHSIAETTADGCG